jgi:hypothetical protein
MNQEISDKEKDILALISRYERATTQGKRISKSVWNATMGAFLEDNDMTTELKTDSTGRYWLREALHELRAMLFEIRKNRNWSKKG